MILEEKLKFIQKLSGLKQTELALRLGVSFATFNRWLNGHAKARKTALVKIDKLYREFSFEKEISETLPEAESNIILLKRKAHPDALREIIDNPDIRDQFFLSLTYNSNRIEGSTLSENETAAVLFQNAALPNKTITEQVEARNHRAALEYLFNKKMLAKPITEDLIMKLHGMIMNTIKSDAGQYRNHAVRIVGSFVPTANYLKIGKLMGELITDINKKGTNVIAHTAYIHSRFEQIHPFSDGNGRVGRLLMSVMLLKNNFAPAVIRQKNRVSYYKFLSKAQLHDDIKPLTEFVTDAIIGGYKILERR